MRSSASSRSRIVGVHGGDVADEAELGVAGAGDDEPGVLARQPDGERAVDVDAGDDVAVDLADEDHAGDVDGLGVGDPQAVAELGLLPEPVHERRDLGPAAVHDDRAQADGVQQHDVLGELARPARRSPWRCRRTSRRPPRRRTAGCTAAPRRAPRPGRRVVAPRHDGAHVLVDVGVGEVVGEEPRRAVAGAEVAAQGELGLRPRPPAASAPVGARPLDTTTSS